MPTHILNLNGKTEIDVSGAPINHALGAVTLDVRDGNIYASWPEFDADVLARRSFGYENTDLDELDEDELEEYEKERESYNYTIAQVRASILPIDGKFDLEIYNHTANCDDVAESKVLTIDGVDYEVRLGYNVRW